MERLVRPLYITLVGLGILLSLILGPTGWVFRNVAENLRGDVPEAYVFDPSAFLVSPVSDSKQPLVSDSEKIRKADEHAAKVNTPAAWAQDLRTHLHHQVWNQPGSVGFQEARGVLAVAEKGHAVDPENAFFTLAQAQVLWQLGQHSAALRALQAAADSKGFDDYTTTDVRERLSEYQATQGYRGENPLLVIQLSPPFDHIFAMKSTYKNIVASKPDDRTRLAMLQTSGLMSESSTNIVEALVAEAMAEMVLHDPRIKAPKDPQGRQAYYRTRATNFEQEFLRTGVSMQGMRPTEIVDHQQRLKQAAMNYINGPNHGLPLNSKAPAFLPEVLGKILALLGIASVVLVGILWVTTRLGVPELYPFVAALLVQLLALHWAGQGPLVYTTLLVGAVLNLRLIKSANRTQFDWALTVLVALLLAAIAISEVGNTAPPPHAAIITASTFFACLLSQAQKRLHWSVVGTAFVLAGAALFFGWHSVDTFSDAPNFDFSVTDRVFKQEAGALHNAMLAFCLCAPLAVGILPFRQLGLRRFASSAFLATTVFLAIVALSDLRLNQDLHRYRLQSMDEVKIIRTAAGL